MRISDWSSDVCSSDLGGRVVAARAGSTAGGGAGAGCAGVDCMVGAAAAVSSENSFNCLVDSIAFGIEHAHFGFDPVADFLVHGVRREAGRVDQGAYRSEEHTSELQSLMRSSYAVFCL